MRGLPTLSKARDHIKFGGTILQIGSNEKNVANNEYTIHNTQREKLNMAIETYCRPLLTKIGCGDEAFLLLRVEVGKWLARNEGLFMPSDPIFPPAHCWEIVPLIVPVLAKPRAAKSKTILQYSNIPYLSHHHASVLYSTWDITALTLVSLAVFWIVHSEASVEHSFSHQSSFFPALRTRLNDWTIGAGEQRPAQSCTMLVPLWLSGRNTTVFYFPLAQRTPKGPKLNSDDLVKEFGVLGGTMAAQRIMQGGIVMEVQLDFLQVIICNAHCCEIRFHFCGHNCHRHRVLPRPPNPWPNLELFPGSKSLLCCMMASWHVRSAEGQIFFLALLHETAKTKKIRGENFGGGEFAAKACTTANQHIT